MNEVYGIGWSFPPKFSVASGVLMTEGLEDVRQGMSILFRTIPGERVMRPSFGCELLPMLFENIDDQLVSELTTAISDSVLRHEPRVELETVSAAPDPQSPERLRVLCVYRARGHDKLDRITATLDVNGDGQMVMP
ncbi:MAG: GPW/gp25 family protein [Actinobacteria bacterium]|nr:GPW/gp25 family protein [Actinomycetota bacterium]